MAVNTPRSNSSRILRHEKNPEGVSSEMYGATRASVDNPVATIGMTSVA